MKEEKRNTTIKIFAIVMAVCLVLGAIFGGIGLYRHSSKSEDKIAASAAKSVKSVKADKAEKKVTDKEDAAAVAESGNDEIVNQREIFTYDEKTSQIAYINSIDQETFNTFVENLNKNWDVGKQTKDQFIADHPEIFSDYLKDENGKILVPWSDAQMTNQDHARQYATVEMGLNKNPINDALDFPNAELTEADVKAIKAASVGQKVKLEKDLEVYEIAIFKDWLSKPVVFEAFINLMLDQKIGSEYTLRDNWTGPTQFIKAYDKAREDGEGVNHWLRCFEDKEGKQYYYTNEEYIYDYVIPFISFVYEQPFNCEVLKSNQHYSLIAGDNDILRKAQLNNYTEKKASFTWRFLLKNDTVGLILGDNARDGRPEILNYTVQKKPGKSSHKKSSSTSSQQVRSGGGGDSSGGGGGSTPTPTPTPTPSNTPEYKHPSQGSASQGNAPVGGGKNDDSGPGTWKPDQGNSKSETVEGSQAHADTVVNVDGAKAENYDKGPAADATDNGAVPDTSAKENQIGTNQEAINTTQGTDQSTGQKADTTTTTNPSTGQSEPVVNDGAISAPPVED